MLANAGIVLVLHGGLGFVGLILARKLGLPDIWDSAISNRGRFIIPALIGLGLGIVFIIADLIFSPVNGIGRLPHPPFLTATVADLSTGIGEETLFRLFLISFWIWLIARLLRGPGRGRSIGSYRLARALGCVLSGEHPLLAVTNASPRVVVSCFHPPSRHGMVVPSADGSSALVFPHHPHDRTMRQCAAQRRATRSFCAFS